MKATELVHGPAHWPLSPLWQARLAWLISNRPEATEALFLESPDKLKARVDQDYQQAMGVLTKNLPKTPSRQQYLEVENEVLEAVVAPSEPLAEDLVPISAPIREKIDRWAASLEALAMETPDEPV